MKIELEITQMFCLCR